MRRALAALVLSLAAVFPALAVEKMTPRDVALAIESGGVALIDIRTPKEWAETGVAQPATLIDMTAKDFVPKLKQAIAANPDKRLAFICRTGSRSGQLTTMLEQAGLGDVIDVTGGMAGKGGQKGWIAEGLPLRKP
ncbi:MAG: rhodanese-like domain-containing protein [Rhizobiaceae bacterium]